MPRDLSIIIPARNEEFLKNTVEDVLSHTTERTNIIVILDGEWSDPPLDDNPRLRVIHHGESVGQRAAINEGVRLTDAKFICKLDAHCSISDNFESLMDECPYDTTVVPLQYNLHVFDWKCKLCGDRTYMGPALDFCVACNRPSEFEKVLVWKRREHRKSASFCFDSELHFQYFGEYTLRKGQKADIVETMSILGACFMMHRERYWELGGSDEQHGSWGQQGVEIACKSWLSGGRVIVNKKAYFSHFFRTRDGFSFPYPNPGITQARKHSQQLWRSNTWPLAVRPLSWLVQKFWPVKGWSDQDLAALKEQEKGNPNPKRLTKGIVYYTENRCPEPINTVVRDVLKRCVGSNSDIVSVSLKPISNFGQNVVLDREPGTLTYFMQILAGLEASKADIVFLTEHDVLYHPSHFEFIPPTEEAYYFNENTVKVDAKTGQGVFYYTKQVSGLCAYRHLLLTHYRKRIAKMASNVQAILAKGEIPKNSGHSRHCGYEPGCHMYPRGIDNIPAIRWMSEYPNIDLRHGKNWTKTKWRQEDFRDPKACLGWTLMDEVPGWGITKGRMVEFLENLRS